MSSGPGPSWQQKKSDKSEQLPFSTKESKRFFVLKNSTFFFGIRKRSHDQRLEEDALPAAQGSIHKNRGKPVPTLASSQKQTQFLHRLLPPVVHK